MVVDLNIMSCPRVPTLGMYSRMILHQARQQQSSAIDVKLERCAVTM